MNKIKLIDYFDGPTRLGGRASSIGFSSQAFAGLESLERLEMEFDGHYKEVDVRNG